MFHHGGVARIRGDVNVTSECFDHQPADGGSNVYVRTTDVTRKFTGQIRDQETGQDFFNARYFTAALGRFNSPDRENAGSDLADPQTWNGYGYVRNNPLVLTDPSGQLLEATAIDAAGGDPFGAGIGLLVDIFDALFGLFGGGGGSAAPPPPPVSSYPGENRPGFRRVHFRMAKILVRRRA